MKTNLNLHHLCRTCQKPFQQRHPKDYRCGACYSASGKKSSRKGKNNEADFAKKLEKTFNDKFQDRTHKYPPYRIRRTPMSGAAHLDWPADITFLNPTPQYSVLRTLHIDLKHQENWSPERWWQEEKALVQSSGTFSKVVIVMKKNHGEQFAFMKWDDLQGVLLELEGYRREENNE